MQGYSSAPPRNAAKAAGKPNKAPVAPVCYPAKKAAPHAVKHGKVKV